MASTLRADTYTTPFIPIIPSTFLPPNVPATCSHGTSTLISGAKEATLSDPSLIIQQRKDIAAWVKATIPGKTLTKIFITHCHGDHFYAVSELLQHFPDAQAVATAATVAHINSNAEGQVFEQFWEPAFPNQLERPID